MSFTLTSKFNKTLLVVISAILITALLIVLFISPITKYLIEKYDEKYTGRQITTDWVYVNPFTGYMHFKNLKIYESKMQPLTKEGLGPAQAGDSVFFSANSLSLNISILKLFSKSYEIRDVTIDHPRGVFVQNKVGFNISDLVKLFSSDSKIIGEKNIVHYSILDIKIIDGEFYYRDPLFPINYFIKNANFESDGTRWNSDTIAVNFSFKAGIGSGEMNGKFMINIKNNDYKYSVDVHKFDLNIIEQYLKDLTNYGSFSANLDANINSIGNLNDGENVTTKGTIKVNDFHFGKNSTEDYASFDKLVLVINEMSPKKHIYLFDSLLLSHPYFKYEQYDYLDNLQTMFGKDGNKLYAATADNSRFNLVIEISRYIKVLARNFFQSYYQVNRFVIYNGDLKYNDYSLNEKFAIDLNPMNVIADSIDKNHRRVNVSFKSDVKPFGSADVSLSINPKDTGDFDMTYHFLKFPVSMFNPYTISYTSFPLDRGTMEVNGVWNVRNGIIKSNNHLVILDPRVTQRISNKNSHWLPLPLIMSFARERGNVIDYEIPITGNLKNPNFHLHDVLSDVVKNIFVKPVTTPYRMEVKSVETEIEKSLSLKWEMSKSELTSTQQKFVEKMADFLKDNTDASLSITPQLYLSKEKEYILFFEAKKKYLIDTHSLNTELNEGDSDRINKMSIKDSLFTHYINKLANDSMLFTMQDKCAKIIGEALVRDKLNKLNKEREDVFLSYFKKMNVEKQVHFSSSENVIPYNGFSFYKIKYQGEFPESVQKAFKKMNELNNEAPREKFKNDRKNNKVAMRVEEGRNH